ncbi:MAG: protease SohB [Pseudomonadota bacterium]
MEFLFDYLGFLARAVTIVVAILVVLGFAFANAARGGEPSPFASLSIKHVNRELEDLKATFEDALTPAAERKGLEKSRRKAEKAQAKADARKAKREAKQKTTAASGGEADSAGGQGNDGDKADSGADAGRVFVLDFEGDLQASSVTRLRREITGVLTIATKADEVLLRIESPGGLVHGYGLAASQLDRIRQHEIPLTVAVDKVAASGGYLMAAVADRILAAPFAVVGSIGVVAQIPNLHRLLKKNDVDFEVITAGEHKRTLTMFGENTPEAREKFEAELTETHELFQSYVQERRPQLDVAAVATGESWYGTRALELGLVDRIVTSDSYLVERAEKAEIYRVSWDSSKKPLERLLERFARTAAPLGRALALARGLRW